MQIYSVGGYVRDTLLRRRGYHLPEGDRDWVVIGETPESMLRRGFKPVGGDFPVFLHPKTHEEYALARTERKTAPGYHGFVFHAAPNVTLEEDLLRRDLTINAIAMDSNGALVDPFNGYKDVEAGVLRHVSDAFREDPVRILRTARFAAKLPGFSLAPETLNLMRSMVDSGEADALVSERILSELIKGLHTPVPCRMFDVLIACGLWQRRFGSVRLSATLRARIHRSHQQNFSSDLQLALLSSGIENTNGSSNSPKAFLSDLRASSAAQSLAQLLCGPEGALIQLTQIRSAQDAVKFFKRVDAVRKRERAEMLLRFRHGVLLGEDREPGPTLNGLIRALDAWCGVDAGKIASTATSPKAIPPLVEAARTLAVLKLYRL